MTECPLCDAGPFGREHPVPFFPPSDSTQMADAVEKIAAMIPSTYYDIIARMIPGAATGASFMWVNEWAALQGQRRCRG